MKREIELFCTKHWNPIVDSRLHLNPINGMAVTEFLLRRFMSDVSEEPTFKRDLELGLTYTQAQYKALANLAPICCLYDVTIPYLCEACRYNKLAITHPEMNNEDDPEGKYHIL